MPRQGAQLSAVKFEAKQPRDQRPIALCKLRSTLNPVVSVRVTPGSQRGSEPLRAWRVRQIPALAVAARADVWEQGQGAPILLIHGGVFSDWFVPILSSAALAGFRLIRVRRRLWPRSSASARHRAAARASLRGCPRPPGSRFRPSGGPLVGCVHRAAARSRPPDRRAKPNAHLASARRRNAGPRTRRARPPSDRSSYGGNRLFDGREWKVRQTPICGPATIRSWFASCKLPPTT